MKEANFLGSMTVDIAAVGWHRSRSRVEVEEGSTEVGRRSDKGGREGDNRLRAYPCGSFWRRRGTNDGWLVMTEATPGGGKNQEANRVSKDVKGDGCGDMSRWIKDGEGGKGGDERR